MQWSFPLRLLRLEFLEGRALRAQRLLSVYKRVGFSACDRSVAELRPPSAESLIVRIPIARFQHADALLLEGQAHGQPQSLALGAFDREFTAVFAHNPSHDQQSEAGAAVLGGIIRLEDMA